MTTSAMGDDPRGAGLGWSSKEALSSLWMVYNACLCYVNSWRNDSR